MLAMHSRSWGLERDDSLISPRTGPLRLQSSRTRIRLPCIAQTAYSMGSNPANWRGDH